MANPPSDLGVSNSCSLSYTERILPVFLDFLSSTPLGSNLETPAPNNVSIVCFSFKLWSTGKIIPHDILF